MNGLRNAIYYSIKPALPRRLRLGVRGWVARRIRRGTAGVWPILPAAANPPPNWSGWPQGHGFAWILTHDVEGPGGLRNVRRLAELELEFGVRSSFNFVPEGKYRVPARLRKWLEDHGFEVGVHDLRHDGWLFSSRRAFVEKSRRINAHLEEWNACGFRAAFMRHRLEWMDGLKILYDSSTFDTDPFEPEPWGTCTVFPSIVSAGRNRFVELPVTLPQDSTLFLLLQETSDRIWREKFAWIASHGGLATLNVHPDYLDFSDCGSPGTYPVRIYRDFLSFATSAGGWHPLPRAAARVILQSNATNRIPIP